MEESNLSVVNHSCRKKAKDLLRMEYTSLVPCKLEFFESSMDLCPLESFKGFSDRNSISPLTESNRTVEECIHCNDRPDYECAECTCQICGHKTKAAKRYKCYSCKKVFHEWCQNITEDSLATNYWQCMNCRPTDLAVNESAVDSVVKKFSKQIIYRQTTAVTTRKFNNSPRTTECTSVPANHFGPIPNIPVGMCWEYRLQASEAGVHRPLVAGIHGRENEGAYSIVISGVYPDDVDNGDEFYYTGSGGKKKDPSKRLGAQIRNQLLTKGNRALALCCDCPLNDKEGGRAKNWRNGKPVRVIRNWKLAKTSQYAPTEGNRYDGIYKVVKYFPQKGHSGFMIWRYLLKRDDPTPAPWTTEGKKLIEEMGLKMIKGIPSILENEFRQTTTIKVEVTDEEPLKKRIRIRRKAGDSLQLPPAKRRPVNLNISAPNLARFKFKEERLSPPPTPPPMVKYEDDVKPNLSRLSNDSNMEYPCIGELKSSPTHEEPMTPSSIDFEQEDNPNNGMGSFLQISSTTSMAAERTCVSNTTYTEHPVLAHSSSCVSTSQNILTTSTEFTQSVSSFSYHNNGFINPMPFPNPDYLTSINPAFPNHSRPYFSANGMDQPTRYPPQPDPLPLKLSVSNVRSLSSDEFGFKPIKLTKPAQLEIKPDPDMPPSVSVDDTQSTIVIKEEPMDVEEGGQSYQTTELDTNLKELISNDVLNRGWWDMCILKYLPLGKDKFMKKVSEIFTCPICKRIIEKPVTLRCESRHSACWECMNYRLESLRVRSCPSCQETFGPSTKIKINENLSRILTDLFYIK